MSDLNDSKKLYYKEIIMKQEGRKWVEYYSILSGTSWLFTVRHNRQSISDGVVVEVGPDAFCAYGEKTCYRFPFWVQCGKQKHNFKCETKLQRYKWMYAIRLCASRKPPHAIPNHLPTGSSGSVRVKRGTRNGTGSLKIPINTQMRTATSNPNLTLTRTQSCDYRRGDWENKKISISDLLQVDDAKPGSSKMDNSGLTRERVSSINLGVRDYPRSAENSHDEDDTDRSPPPTIKKMEKKKLQPQISISKADDDDSENSDSEHKKSSNFSRISTASKAAANKFLMTTGLRKSKSFTNGLNIDDKEFDIFMDSYIEKENKLPMGIINPIVQSEKVKSKKKKHQGSSSQKPPVKRALGMLAHNSFVMSFQLSVNENDDLAGSSLDNSLVELNEKENESPAVEEPKKDLADETLAADQKVESYENEAVKKAQSLTSLVMSQNLLKESSPRRENSEPSLINYATLSKENPPALILNGLNTTCVR